MHPAVAVSFLSRNSASLSNIIHRTVIIFCFQKYVVNYYICVQFLDLTFCFDMGQLGEIILIDIYYITQRLMFICLLFFSYRYLTFKKKIGQAYISVFVHIYVFYFREYEALSSCYYHYIIEVINQHFHLNF